MNTYFKKTKARKLIWINPNGIDKHEIGLIIASDKYTIDDLTVGTEKKPMV